MRALIAALLALRADSFHASTRQRSAAARAVIPERVPLDILYEDGDVIVINKPAGMIAQHSPGSVERAIAYHLNATGACRWGSASWPWNSDRSFEGIVHRLDKGTSGAMAVAKHPRAARALRAAFAERRARKTYLAIAVGLPSAAVVPPPAARRADHDRALSAAALDDDLAPRQKRLAREIKGCGRDAKAALRFLERAAAERPSASCFSAAISVCMRAGERDEARGRATPVAGRDSE